MPDEFSTRRSRTARLRRVPTGVWLAAAFGLAGTAVFDMLTPLGVAGGAPYVLVVLVGLWSRSRLFTFGLALACTSLALLGTFFSAGALAGAGYVYNRGIALAGIFAATALVLYQINLQNRVRAAFRREREYLQVIDVILLALDADGRITLLNRRGCELLGCTEGEVRGKDWFSEFLPEDDRDEVRDMFRRSVRGEAELPQDFENEVVARTGSRHVIRWSNMLLRDEAGQVRSVLASGKDVTEQQQTEVALDRTRSELSQVEKLMAAVVESAVEGIITIEPDGVIRTANRSAHEMFGYDEGEMTGRNVKMLMPSPDREQHDGYLRKYVETGVAGIIGKGREVTAVRKDGTQFPIHLSISDVSGHGMRLFTGVVRDLTDEKAMQRKLQEQEALAAIGQMAAVVAHEVKNPLAGIAGVIQVLRGRQDEGTPEHKVMGEVLERIDALVETLQDLLFYSRPRELRKQPVNISELLRETVRLIEEDPRTGRVTLNAPEVDCTLHLDLDYIREALLNLYLNAAQAMDGKGEIRTEVRNEENHCVVSIADTGPGIPENIRERVFEPFFTTKGRGTGLGLALVKRVVERHEGELSIECPKQGGTVVSMKLPHPSDEPDEPAGQAHGTE